MKPPNDPFTRPRRPQQLYPTRGYRRRGSGATAGSAARSVAAAGLLALLQLFQAPVVVGAFGAGRRHAGCPQGAAARGRGVGRAGGLAGDGPVPGRLARVLRPVPRDGNGGTSPKRWKKCSPYPPRFRIRSKYAGASTLRAKGCRAETAMLVIAATKEWGSRMIRSYPLIDPSQFTVAICRASS